jgi:hypothetical protein
MVGRTCFQGELHKIIIWSTKCRKTDVDYKGRNPFPLMSKGESNFIERFIDKSIITGGVCV